MISITFSSVFFRDAVTEKPKQSTVSETQVNSSDGKTNITLPMSCSVTPSPSITPVVAIIPKPAPRTFMSAEKVISLTHRQTRTTLAP